MDETDKQLEKDFERVKEFNQFTKVGIDPDKTIPLGDNQKRDTYFKDAFSIFFPDLQAYSPGGGYPIPDMISKDNKTLVEIGDLSIRDDNRNTRGYSYYKLGERDFLKAATIRVKHLFSRFKEADEVWIVPYPHNGTSRLSDFTIFRFRRTIIVRDGLMEALKDVKKLNESLDDLRALVAVYEKKVEYE